MIIVGRHRALANETWSELAVHNAIEEIVTDSIAHFHPDTFWPAHSSDDGVGDGNPSFYYGAAGVIWALDVGRGRYSLWTGDIGLAIYLWDCITGEPRFPTIDVF